MTGSARLHAALAVLALVAGAIAALFAWQPGLATFHDDSASYLVMAQAFSPWHPAGAPVLAAMPYEKYPPAFPWLLAITGAAFDWRWAHVLVAACFGASVWLLGVHAQRITSSPPVAFAAALVYAALPGAWLNMKGILSEFPFMALAFATLAWHGRAAAGEWTRGRVAVLGALLAAALLTRTIGLALWLAIAAVEAAAFVRGRDRVRGRGACVALGASLLATGLWYALRPSGGDDAYLASTAGVARKAAQDGLAWFASLLGANASALFDAWLNALVIYWGEPWQPKFVAGALLAAAGLGAIAWRALRAEADGLYCVLFLGILLAWPFPGQMYRLLLPIVPLVLAATAWAIAAIARRRLPERTAARVACYAMAVPLAFCVPALFYIAERARLPGDSGTHPDRKDIMEFYRIPFLPAAQANAALQLRAFGDMERIRATTPEGARVMTYGPAYVALLAGRFGVPLDFPADEADMSAQVRRGHPDFIYLSAIHPRDSAHRLGDPLSAARLAGAARPAWRRAAPDGTLEAVLLDARGAAPEAAR